MLKQKAALMVRADRKRRWQAEFDRQQGRIEAALESFKDSLPGFEERQRLELEALKEKAQRDCDAGLEALEASGGIDDQL